MFAESPIRWTDPTTWPWIFYVWLAFAAVGFVKPAWSWLQRRRAAGWPTVDGRIESVEVRKPAASFTNRRGYYIAELAYSYCVAGALNSGRYKQELPTEQEAEEFVRGLKGLPVVVHYNSRRPSNSTLLEPDIKTAKQNRPPAEVSDFSMGKSLPDWTIPFLWVFICISVAGLVLSVWIHIGALRGRRIAPEWLFSILNAAMVVVCIPAIFTVWRLVGNLSRRDLWKVMLKRSPSWMRYMVYVFSGYAFINVMLFFNEVFSRTRGTIPPVSEWRKTSADWMVFYSAGLAILYSAVDIIGSRLRCVNGHSATSGAAYCTRCGQPVLRSLNSV